MGRLLVGFEGASQGGDGALLAAFDLAGGEVVPVFFILGAGVGSGVQGLFDHRLDSFAQMAFLLAHGAPLTVLSQYVQHLIRVRV